MVESNHTNLVTRHIAGKGEMGSADTLSVHNCTHTGLIERRETGYRGPPKPGAAGVAVAVSPMAQRGCAVMVMLRRRDDR
jgi:hypothetical protein